MLSVNQISKSYDAKLILNSVSFSISQGERWGLIGSNGCGKTTLLKIITGIIKPDKGTVQLTPRSLRIGYLPQGLEFTAGETLASFLNRWQCDTTLLTKRLEEIALNLSLHPEALQLQDEYDLTLQMLAYATQNSGILTDILTNLDLIDKDPEIKIDQLSGGQKTRLALASVLISSPQLLILDEPTNHLDISILEWLENWLVAYPFPMLIVSHDRTFLDQTVTGILELEDKTRSIKIYNGNYTEYLRQKEIEQRKQWQAYQEQKDQIQSLKAAAAHMRGLAKPHRGGKADSGDKFAKGFFANRGKETINKAKNIEARLEKLLNEERIEKPRQSWHMFMQFGETAETGRDVLVTQNVSIGYDSIPLLQNINLHLRYGERVALIGANGSGKTSFIRTILGYIPPIFGTFRLGTNVKIGYMPQEHETLPPKQTPLEVIQHITSCNETEARSFLSLYLFKGDNVFTPVKNLSYGERSRLMLAGLVAQGSNFLLLDEPINHLDIPSRTQFEQAMTRFPGTILAVVHDRYFIHNFATQIWQITDRTIQWRKTLG